MQTKTKPTMKPIEELNRFEQTYLEEGIIAYKQYNEYEKKEFWGIYNHRMKEKFEARFDSIENFYNGFAIAKYKDEWCIINRQTTRVEFSDIKPIRRKNGYLCNYKNEEFIFCNNMRFIGYRNVSHFRSFYICKRQDNKYDILNSRKELIIECIERKQIHISLDNYIDNTIINKTNSLDWHQYMLLGSSQERIIKEHWKLKLKYIVLLEALEKYINIIYKNRDEKNMFQKGSDFGDMLTQLYSYWIEFCFMNKHFISDNNIPYQYGLFKKFESLSDNFIHSSQYKYFSHLKNETHSNTRYELQQMFFICFEISKLMKKCDLDKSYEMNGSEYSEN